MGEEEANNTIELVKRFTKDENLQGLNVSREITSTIKSCYCDEVIEIEEITLTFSFKRKRKKDARDILGI